MKIGMRIRMMPDDVTELMIPVRKTKTTWNQ